MLTISPSSPIGNSAGDDGHDDADQRLAQIRRPEPRMHVANNRGSRPSFAIEKKMRAWPNSSTRITVVSPASAPNLMSTDSQVDADDVDRHRDRVGDVELR